MGFESKAKISFRVFLVVISLWLSLDAFAGAWHPQRFFLFTQERCLASGIDSDSLIQSSQKSEIIRRGHPMGTRYRIKLDNSMEMKLDVLQSDDGRPPRFINRLFDTFDNPSMMVALASDCSLQMLRKVNYDDHKRVLNITSLDQNFELRGPVDWVNPPLKFIHQETQHGVPKKEGPAQIRVGLVDSGVNYLIPAINNRLARDAKNQLIGYDFWDMDALPFDANLSDSGFQVQRHGTRTASVLLKEAPTIELVPYRYPRPDMTRMKALVEHADSHQVSILALPMGSNGKKDWATFQQVAREHAHILFIVSAGNNGRNIDRQPVYPAAFELENILVVTSANDFVRPAERTNWGTSSVDFLVPAEGIDAIDYSARPVRVSGSSYAVSRMAALAARVQSEHRHWRAKQIIAEIKSRFSFVQGQVLKWVKSGYIADPLAGATVGLVALDTPNLVSSLTTKGKGKRLPLDILRLDPRWMELDIEQVLQQAFDILGQCDIVNGTVSLRALKGSDYLSDLSTGSARTLLEAANTQGATVVFARDTRMQPEYMGEAFGLGNTTSRPWLTHSVWLMSGVGDPGIALAHELFHVLANNGEHIQDEGNLMGEDTQPDNLFLTSDQCHQARVNGTLNGLLVD